MKIDGRNYSWTQPICDTCFAGLFPRNENPSRIKEAMREDEHCCVCGTHTHNGLYIRINPATVDHPTPEEGDAPAGLPLYTDVLAEAEAITPERGNSP